jgi:hypothetical protein
LAFLIEITTFYPIRYFFDIVFFLFKNIPNPLFFNYLEKSPTFFEIMIGKPQAKYSAALVGEDTLLIIESSLNNNDTSAAERN